MTSGHILIITGALLICIGLFLLGGPGPLGRLPGDIEVTRPGFSLYIPLTTMILLSVGITIIFWLFGRFF
jgi:hypothetical protein